MGLFEVVEGGLCEDEVTLIWIVFNWFLEDDSTLFKVENIRAFNKAAIILILVEQIVPKVMLREDFSISEDN